MREEPGSPSGVIPPAPSEWSRLCVLQNRGMADAGLYCARLIRRQRDDVVEIIGFALELWTGSGFAGSGWAATMDWQKSQRRQRLIGAVIRESREDLTRLLRAADDQARSIADLMENDREAYVAITTLLRGSAEAILRVCYMLDPNASPLKRFLRAAAYQIETIEGNSKTAREYGARMSEAENKLIADNRHNSLNYYRRAGLGLSKRRPNDTFFDVIEFEGVRETTKFNATDAAARFLPNEPFEWHSASGAVHSNGWLLPSLVGGLESKPLATKEQNYGTVTNSLLNLAEALLEVLAGMSGLPLEPALKRLHTRRKGLFTQLGYGSFSPDDRDLFKSFLHGTAPPSSLGESFVRRTRPTDVGDL